VDESLAPVTPQTLWAALITFNVHDQRVQLILGGLALAVFVIVTCGYCAFRFDDSCRRS
jgi:hypothetical protein